LVAEEMGKQLQSVAVLVVVQAEVVTVSLAVAAADILAAAAV
jgi:hypothetical protein